MDSVSVISVTWGERNAQKCPVLEKRLETKGLDLATMKYKGGEIYVSNDIPEEGIVDREEENPDLDKAKGGIRVDGVEQ